MLNETASDCKGDLGTQGPLTLAGIKAAKRLREAFLKLAATNENQTPENNENTSES